MKKRALSIQDLCLIGAVTSILIIMAQISIPLPLGIPMTMQTFAVMLAGILLGPRKGTLTIVIYLFLGSIGLPVFSNFRGGLQCLIGPTGGTVVLPYHVLADWIGYQIFTTPQGYFLADDDYR